MILQRLREATRPDHERLEEHIDLLGRPWSLAFYKSLLQKFYGIYAVLEPPTLSQKDWHERDFDTTHRIKLPALAKDLCFLGLSEAEISELPRPTVVPQVNSFAAALGAAYVMEGSTLGGQIISRHLHKELGLEIDKGLNFFGSYGEAVGPMWREFTNVLNSYQGNDAEQQIAVETAVQTFRAFDDWLTDIL
jgi:heme oxygenase